MSQHNNNAVGKTDLIFQEFRLYIEGVQVPFIGISVSSGIGNFPTATIEIPPQAGLVDITRYYQPKVYVSFMDPNTGDECTLFNGLIAALNYTKSAQSPGNTSIVFQCVHRLTLTQNITLDFSGFAGENGGYVTNPNQSNAAIDHLMFNSFWSIAAALTGVDAKMIGGTTEVNLANTVAGTADIHGIPQKLKDYKDRLIGFPGVFLNIWNQLKKKSYQNNAYYESMVKLYIPLMEYGLRFFERIGGHYLIESKLDGDKQDPCLEESTGAILVPPGMKMYMRNAVQAEIAIRLVQQNTNFSGELTDVYKLFYNYMASIEYDVVTLTSPANVPKDPVIGDINDNMSLETIVKPQLPFYYSPICNVILPNMFTNISITQDEMNIPSRITVTNDLLPGNTGTGFGTHFRAPASIREAIAEGARELNIDNPESTSFQYDLATTTAGANTKVGKYEFGRGIKHVNLLMPNWLAFLSSSKEYTEKLDREAPPQPGTPEYDDMVLLRDAWNYRYAATPVVDRTLNKVKYILLDETKAALNPWSLESNIPAYQRLMFAAADYKYTTMVAQSKAGSLTCIFNPYIVPGYPMDIIDPSPVQPSFHAYCVGVTHSIGARSISTSVNFVSAISYTELANYYLQFIHPWLQTTLRTTSKFNDAQGYTVYTSSIINNTPARLIADDFYRQVFAVAAAAPEQIYNFDDGLPMPLKLVVPGAALDQGSTASMLDVNGGELNPNLSAEGNLALVYRPIETRQMLEEQFDLKFIEMKPANYNATVVQYTDSVLSSSQLLEPGQSQFLQYDPKDQLSKQELSDIAAATAPIPGV